jgi:Carboxypeptidase regulatory-like domain
VIAHAVVLSLLIAAAQSTTAVAPPKESAVISGVVLDLDSATPVRSAVVSLSRSYGRGISRTVTTDAAGRFEIADLPGGEYVLSVIRFGYLPTNFGEQRPGGPGATITVADAETRDDVAIPISRGGTISGRVFNEHGDAVPGVQVQAMRYRFEDGKRVLQPAFMDRTDDRGDFRLFTLPPGEYYVYAEPRTAFGFAALAAPGSRSISGAAGFVGAIGTYHPNSSTPARARAVTVLSSRETTGINVVLATGKPARVRGRAVTAGGEALSRVSLAMKGGVLGIAPVTILVAVREDGSFEAPSVAPGEYIVTARSGPEADAEMARVEITVAGDVDDLLLVGVRGGSLRGTITTEDGDAVPLPAAQISVRLVPATNERAQPPSTAPVQPDYTFELKELVGSFRLAADVAGFSGHWAAKAIRWRGDDVTHRTFEFRSGEAIDGLEVVLSERWATLSGVVRDDRNVPVGDTAVLLFPADESLWITGSRYIRPMRTDRDGRYGVSTLLPGNYLLAVSNDVETRRLDDVSFLRSLVERAAQVVLKDEDDLVFHLRVTRSP